MKKALRETPKELELKKLYARAFQSLDGFQEFKKKYPDAREILKTYLITL